MDDPYTTLGVSRAATAEEIKRAFRRAASVHHPDRGGDAQKFAAARAAYDLLSDPERRTSLDLGGDPTSGIVSEEGLAKAAAEPATVGPCPICSDSGSVRVGVKGNSNKILFWQSQPCPRGCMKRG